MVEEVKKGLKTMNGFSGVPQKTTFGGMGLILYQLSQVLSGVPVGGFIDSLMVMTYGAVFTAYSPIIFGVMAILFNENKFMKLVKGK